MLFLLATLLAQISYSHPAMAQDLSLSRNVYFSSFNHDDRDAVKGAASLEAEMIFNSQVILDWAKQTPSQLNQNAGMYLVYTGMLILDRNNGFLEGKLKEPEMDRAKIVQRYELSQQFLDLALKLAPDDERIASWNIANTLRREKAEFGKVSDATLDKVIALAIQMPIFHLFNALTLSSDIDFGAAREKKILELADYMSGKDSPCGLPFFRRGIAKKCNTTSKTPFAMHGTTVYFGDEFLKHSLEVSETNPEESELYLDKAMKMYRRLNFFLFKLKTNRWDKKENLEERIQLVQAMKQNDGKKAESIQNVRVYMKTRSYLDVYTCFSCHQDGHSKSPLMVQLPR